MNNSSFDWPIGFLLAALGALVVAVVVPWLLSRRRGPFVIFLPALMSSLIWVAYELRLSALAPLGDPLIRVDLFFLSISACAAWLSAAIACAVAVQTSRDQGQEEVQTRGTTESKSGELP